MPEPQVPAPSQSVSGKPRKRVLIVEDEKPLSHALEMKLTNAGYEAHAVSNGEDALAAALSEPRCDMMLLDLIMPKLDGFSVLQALKAQDVHVPVIILSNLGQEEDRKKAKELGAVNYFVKSNTPISEIVKAVQSVLS